MDADVTQVDPPGRRRRWIAVAVGVALLVGGGVLVRKRIAAASTPFSIPEPAHTQKAVPIPGAMILIPGGTYQMGSTDGFFKQEEPVHEVRVKSFYLDETEVTVAAYAACARSGACVPAPTTVDWVDMIEPHRQMWAMFCNGDRPDRQDHPVNCVDYNQAEIYCKSLGRRLPSEEEWEYVARGGSEQRKYPWGNELPSAKRSNICGAECGETVSKIRVWGPLYPESDGWVGTAPVGSFPEGDAKWGIKDLHGNVQEWLASINCPFSEPACASTDRAARGSGFLSNQAHKVRSARRNGDVTWHRSGDLGVRCAKDAPAEP
jgi:formylglycine-generating enzyme required for sulfatase activity